MQSITLRRPDDWHVHLRDETMLAAVLADTARIFARAIVMPNLNPPICTAAAADVRRIEVEAFAILRDGEGLIDRELLARRIREFGQQHEASLAELWALPLLLRLGLLEQIATRLQVAKCAEYAAAREPSFLEPTVQVKGAQHANAIA